MQVDFGLERSHLPNSSFGQTLNFDANKNSLFIDNGFEETVELDHENMTPESQIQVGETIKDLPIILSPKAPVLTSTPKKPSKAKAPATALKLPPLHACFDKIAYISEENKAIEKWLTEK